MACVYWFEGGQSGTSGVGLGACMRQDTGLALWFLLCDSFAHSWAWCKRSLCSVACCCCHRTVRLRVPEPFLVHCWLFVTTYNTQWQYTVCHWQYWLAWPTAYKFKLALEVNVSSRSRCKNSVNERVDCLQVQVSQVVVVVDSESHQLELA